MSMVMEFRGRAGALWADAVDAARLRRVAAWSALAVVLMLCNSHLLFGGAVRTALFPGELLVSARPWALFSHLFTHVSWYHLLIDMSAFVSIYPLLSGGSGARLRLFGWCALGSVVGTIVSPAAWEVGMAGMSGVDHGLLAALGLQEILAARRQGRGRSWFGILTLGTVLVKALWEAATGTVVFGGFHLGNVGTPVVLCHLGGVLGGVVGVGVCHCFWRLHPHRKRVLYI